MGKKRKVFSVLRRVHLIVMNKHSSNVQIKMLPAFMMILTSYMATTLINIFSYFVI
jgi:hypothetical protein